MLKPTDVEAIVSLDVNISEFSISCPNILSRFKQLLQYLGPAFVISVAYIDPGIFVLEHIEFKKMGF